MGVAIGIRGNPSTIKEIQGSWEIAMDHGEDPLTIEETHSLKVRSKHHETLEQKHRPEAQKVLYEEVVSSISYVNGVTVTVSSASTLSTYSVSVVSSVSVASSPSSV